MKHLRKQDDVDYWKPCRPGAIINVSDSKFERQRRRYFIQSSMAVVIGGIGLLSGVFAWKQRSGDGAVVSENNVASEISLAKLNCDQVHRQLPSYVAAYQLDADQRDEEQQSLIAQFEAHLSYCDACPGKVADALRQV